MLSRISRIGLAACVAIALVTPAHAERHLLTPADIERFVSVTEPRIAPDGQAIAYLVTSIDRDADEMRTAVWLTNWQGTEHVQLTRGESASAPRFSPDGKYLSFLSSRPAKSPAQVWLLDRQGGEARQLTHTEDEIARYDWSPDARHLVLVVRASQGQSPLGSKAGAEAPPPKPIVIDTWHFKGDMAGYLTTSSHSHLYLLDVATGEMQPLTSTPAYNDDLPAWSADGKLIAYVSNHRDDGEKSGLNEIYLIEARAGATPRKLAEAFASSRQHLAFSPDGRTLLLLHGDAPRYNEYNDDRLAVVPVDGGAVRSLTDKLDRAVATPLFNADGKSISVIVEDDGTYYPARVPLAGGAVERLIAGPVAVRDDATAAGHTVVLASSDTQAGELFALEDGQLRKLTSHTEPLLKELELGAVRDIRFKSKDGTEIHGMMVEPPGYQPGRKYPTIVWLHGGPHGQDAHELILRIGPGLERQLLAAAGYVVIGINYRGSSGRGTAFSRSIVADWGHKEMEDVLAAADYVVASGIADPARLGIGGWSYGGILTDYTLANDGRFKAAIAGASSGNQLEMYGTDQYALQWNSEIGVPWQHTALYLRLSYPLLHADRIHTPTLFLGGDKDMNVPLTGGEQMYFALRTLGVPTQLIVYPGQFHTLTRPSFLKDRAERYIAWYAKYLPSPH
jgi:dipeptidyl aminopeptidase/acylaminoacyl peptidase